MHKNRSIYNLAQYQEILTNREKSFKLLLQHKETMQPLVYSPKFKSNWTHSQRKNKFIAIRSRLKPVLEREMFDFVTLTYSTRRNSNKMLYQIHKEHINLFFKELRKIKRNLKYFYVVELTGNLTPHFHVLLSQGITKAQIKKIWFKITGSYIIDKKEVSSKQIINYVAKYLVKQYKNEDPEARKLEYVYKNISRVFIFSRNFFEASEPNVKDKIYQLIAYLTCTSDITDEHIRKINLEALCRYSEQVLMFLSEDQPDHWRNGLPCYKFE